MRVGGFDVIWQRAYEGDRIDFFEYEKKKTSLTCKINVKIFTFY